MTRRKKLCVGIVALVVVIVTPAAVRDYGAAGSTSRDVGSIVATPDPTFKLEGVADELGAVAPTPFVVESSIARKSWSLVFADEFDAPKIDDSVWTACYWWDVDGCSNEGNNELEWYLPRQRFIRDGALVLRASERSVDASNGKTYPYRSGMVTSGRPTDDFVNDPGFAFTYGFVEARLKSPVGQGLWPAFWLLPVTHESRPEIDIFEVLGHAVDTYELHFHTHDDDGERVSFGSEYTNSELQEGWHVVAVHWTPDEIVWFIDGVERWRVEEFTPDEPLYLLLNLAVGGDWPGAPDEDTEFPADFEIDYVRVWQEE